MIRNLLPIVLAIICLAGCTMAPTYSRPAPPVPAGWPAGPGLQEGCDGAEPNRGAVPALPTIGWREFYLDERLQKVIGLALANNRDLRIAALNIEKARGLYRIQRAELFPDVDASGDMNDQRYPAYLLRQENL